MAVETKAEMLSKARQETSSSKAYDILEKLFDDGIFTEIGALAKSSDGYAEAVAAHGTVNGAGVYAYAQDTDTAGGAMSKAQALKIKKLYDLALKTGEPIVAVYDSMGGRLSEGMDLLAAYGNILQYTNRLSGVVPQVSVVVGNCFGTQALIAACADVVVVTEGARLSLASNGEKASADENAQSGTAHLVAKDTDEALEQVRTLLEMLPANNLSGACVVYDSVEAQGTPDDSTSPSQAALAVADADSAVELQAAFGKAVKTLLATVNGTTVGLVAAEGEIDGKSAAKAARFVRFCDAFSIPVVTFVDAEKFCCIKSAAKLTSAYAEATTAKVTFVTGSAYGSVYIALAGTGAAADMTFAWQNACVSALNHEAEAVIMLGDDFGGRLKKSGDPKAERARVVAEYKEEHLTALNAAAEGYVEDVIAPEETRDKLTAVLDMLGSKRVSTLPKKHNNLYL